MFSFACATLFDQYCLCPSAFCIQEIELNKAQWSALFEPYLFFEEYKNYLQIDINAADADDLLGWRGWVESRLRQLTLKVNVGFLYGNTKQKFYAATLNIYFDLLYLPSQVAHPQALDISGCAASNVKFKKLKADGQHIIMHYQTQVSVHDYLTYGINHGREYIFHSICYFSR